MALELGRVRPLLPELLGELFRMALEFGRVLRLLPELLGQLPRMTLQFRDMEGPVMELELQLGRQVVEPLPLLLQDGLGLVAQGRLALQPGALFLHRSGEVCQQGGRGRDFGRDPVERLAVSGAVLSGGLPVEDLLGAGDPVGQARRGRGRLRRMAQVGREEGLDLGRGLVERARERQIEGLRDAPERSPPVREQPVVGDEDPGPAAGLGLGIEHMAQPEQEAARLGPAVAARERGAHPRARGGGCRRPAAGSPPSVSARVQKGSSRQIRGSLSTIGAVPGNSAASASCASAWNGSAAGERCQSASKARQSSQEEPAAARSASFSRKIRVDSK